MAQRFSNDQSWIQATTMPKQQQQSQQENSSLLSFARLQQQQMYVTQEKQQQQQQQSSLVSFARLQQQQLYGEQKQQQQQCERELKRELEQQQQRERDCASGVLLRNLALVIDVLELPDEDTIALQTARSTCAELVEQESNPLVYLSVAAAAATTSTSAGSQQLQHDVAKRLAAYWKLRVAEFGPFEGFLPLSRIILLQQQKLSLSGDNENNDTGGDFCLLPQRDGCGRRMFYARSGSRGNGTRTRDCMSKVFSLLSTTTTLQDGSSNPNYRSRDQFELVLLVHHVINEQQQPDDASPIIPLNLQRFLSDAMPWKVHRIHLVIPYSSSMRSSLLLQQQQRQQELLPALQQCTIFHPNQVCASALFQQFDIPLESIPVEWGGLWFQQQQQNNNHHLLVNEPRPIRTVSSEEKGSGLITKHNNNNSMMNNNANDKNSNLPLSPSSLTRLVTTQLQSPCTSALEEEEDRSLHNSNSENSKWKKTDFMSPVDNNNNNNNNNTGNNNNDNSNAGDYNNNHNDKNNNNYYNNNNSNNNINNNSNNNNNNNHNNNDNNNNNPFSLSSILTTTTVTQEELDELESVMKDLPTSTKEAYMEALEKAPRLIAQESPPAYFLERETITATTASSTPTRDVCAAAFRLAAYWQHRKEIFGPQRAFLPLDVSSSTASEGEMSAAVTSDDIDCMSSGFLVPLPEDEEGRDVFCFDLSRYHHHLHQRGGRTDSSSAAAAAFPALLMRSLFYWCATISMHKPRSRLEGISAIAIVRQKNTAPGAADDDRIDAKPAMDLIEDAFPIKIHSVHLCMISDSQQSILMRLKQRILPLIMLRLKPYHNVQCHVHADEFKPTTTNQHQQPKKRQRHELRVPSLIGGTWEYDRFDLFFAELRRGRRGSTTNNTSAATVAAAVATTSLHSAGRGAAATAASGAQFSLTNNNYNQLHQQQHAAPVAEVYADLRRQTSPNHHMTTTGLQAHFAGQANIPPAHTAAKVPKMKGQQERHSSQNSLPGSVQGCSPNAMRESPSSPVSLGGTMSEHSLIETRSMQLEGLRRVEEAIHMLSDEEKSAYITAKTCVPHLVQAESNPLSYLRFEKYNAWTAAYKIAKYWKYRAEVFGDRAFLPMDLTGNGTMERQDIESICDGYMQFAGIDSEGRSVICYNPQMRRSVTTPLSRIRVAFYLVQTLCENEGTLANGWVTIAMLGTSRFGDSTLDSTVTTGIKMTCEVFPSIPIQTHLVNIPSGLGQRIFYEIIVPIAVRFMGQLLGGNRGVMHVGTREEIFAKLCLYGMDIGALPETVGGPRTIGDHFRWVQDRIKLENGRYGSTGYRLAAEKPSIPQSLGGGAQILEVPAAKPKAAAKGTKRSRAKKTATSPTLVLSHKIDTNIESVLMDLTTAIEMIPRSQKTAYLKALDQAPQLVQRESDAVAFLRRENFNPVTAAQRLVKYWEIRAKIFESRAFLPLDQTGEGALDRRDLVVLGTAYLLCLPKDSQGRSVLFCDGSRLGRSSVQSRLRTSFYMYSMAADSPLSQTDGIILLDVTIEPSFDRANQECLDLVLSVIPVSVRDVHLLRYSADSTDHDHVPDAIDPAMIDYFSFVAKNQVVPLVASSRDSIAKMLEPYGLNPVNLPKSIGGNFGYDRFVQWQELRTRYEWDVPPGVSNKETASMFDFSKVTPLSVMTEEERTERKRRVNVIHSRRKRERERIEIEVLNEQTEELLVRKKILKREHEKLKSLFTKAEAIVRSTSG